MNTNQQNNTMNTNELLEKAKGILLTDGSMNWNFVPKIEGRSHPYIWTIFRSATNFAKLLVDKGEVELAEKVLRDLTDYVVKLAVWYHKNSGRGYGPAEEYYRQWRISCECCCPVQEAISRTAAVLGLKSAVRYAVLPACPRSPQGYRPDASTASLEPIDDKCRQDLVTGLAALLAGEVNFLE
jgi:hypothetical protein